MGWPEAYPPFGDSFTNDSKPLDARVAGSDLTSSTAHNVSARSWVSVTFNRDFPAGDIEALRIVNRQLLDDKLLEEIPGTGGSGQGRSFRYRVFRNWSLVNW